MANVRNKKKRKNTHERKQADLNLDNMDTKERQPLNPNIIICFKPPPIDCNSITINLKNTARQGGLVVRCWILTQDGIPVSCSNPT